MFCSSCGAKIPAGARYCSHCGAEAVAAQPGSFRPAPENRPPMPAGHQPVAPYAGFWQRAGALALDSLILLPVVLLAEDVLAAMFSFSSYAVSFILGMSYFSSMTSSEWQATLGKKAFGIIVTDKNGKRLSYQKAINRYAASLLSGLLLLIGYLVQPFTARKQTLHDILCGTLVVKEGRVASTQVKGLIWIAAFFGLMVFIAAAFFAPVPDDQTAVSPIRQIPIRPDSAATSSPDSAVASPQPQQTPIAPSNTDPRLEAARQRCRQDWFADPVMLNYCIEEQEEAYRKRR